MTRIETTVDGLAFALIVALTSLWSGVATAQETGGYGAGGPAVTEPGVAGGIAGPGAGAGARTLPYGRAAPATGERWEEIDQRIDAELEASRRLRESAGRLEESLTPPDPGE